MGNCPLCHSRQKLLDAAEFEARVAAWLAKYAAAMSQEFGCHFCICSKRGICRNGIKKDCADIFLETARLAVEEEMEDEQIQN